MTRWLPLAALCLVLTRGGFAPAATRLAVLGDGDLAVDRVVALLEPGLGDAEGIQLVERDQLRAVLREQELQAGFTPEAVGQRVILGRLLRADLLVMLRAAAGPDRRFELVVSETHQGLRLLVEPVALGKDVEADAAALRSRVLAAVKRRAERVTAVIAVPPLVCDDFGFAFAADGVAYARVVEQSLVARPGVVVVELAEARALALELAVAAQPRVDRPLPFYVLGSYRSTGSGAARRLSLQLTLNRGDRVLDTAAREQIEPACAALILRDAVNALLDPRLGQPPLPPDPHAEAAQLYERGSLFLRLGQPAEALPLCEASLLLQPRRAAHRDAAKAIVTLWQRERDRQAPRAGGKRPAAAEQNVWEQYLPLLRLGLGHVEAYMKAGPIQAQNDPVISLYLRGFPADEAGAMLLRVAQQKYDAKVEDLTLDFARDLRWATLPRRTDRYALAVSLASRVVRSNDAGAAIAALLGDLDPGKSPPELRDAVERLAASDNPLAREAARQMQARLAGGLTVLGDQSVLAPATAPHVTVAGDWKVTRLDLGIGGVDGIIPCGEGVDAVWGSSDIARPGRPDTLYLLKDSAAPRPVGGCVQGGAPAFDGRYLWAAGDGSRGPEVLIVDPVTEKSWSLTPRDGLPDEAICVFAAAPLGAGRVCAAAQIEREGSRRTWIALLSFDPPHAPKFVSLHEARLMRPAAGMSEADPAVSFSPHAAVTLQPPGVPVNPPAAVVLFRSGGTYYSVAFPDPDSLVSGRGVVVRHEPSFTSARTTAHQEWDFDGGRRYWIAGDRGSTGAVGELRYQSLEGGSHSAATGVPTGALAVTAAGVYVYSPPLQSLYRADAPDHPFQRFAAPLPPAFAGGSLKFARSNHFGLLLMAGSHTYRFEDADGNPLPWKRP